MADRQRQLGANQWESLTTADSRLWPIPSQALKPISHTEVSAEANIHTGRASKVIKMFKYCLERSLSQAEHLIQMCSRRGLLKNCICFREKRMLRRKAGGVSINNGSSPPLYPREGLDGGHSTLQILQIQEKIQRRIQMQMPIHYI